MLRAFTLPLPRKSGQGDTGENNPCVCVCVGGVTGLFLLCMACLVPTAIHLVDYQPPVCSGRCQKLRLVGVGHTGQAGVLGEVPGCVPLWREPGDRPRGL